MRKLLILPLLLAAGFALAAEEPDSGSTAGDTTAQAPAEEKAKPEEPGAAAEDGAGAPSEEQARPRKKEGPKLVSGMSILGNQEAPKSLVIVPWKSSAPGSAIGISPLLDDSARPVDKEVFMRALTYYEIRSAKRQ